MQRRTRRTRQRPAGTCCKCLPVPASLSLQVRHDDLREAAARFVDALAAGKEWLADRRDEQVFLVLFDANALPAWCVLAQLQNTNWLKQDKGICWH